MGISTSLTPYHECDERPIEMMVGKAMCAYANWQRVERDYGDIAPSQRGELCVAYENEYEATVRCIAMLVREGVPTICMAVIERAKQEFGI